MCIQPLTLETNGVYILLSDRGESSYSFHWAIYLAKSETDGIIFHIINPTGSTDWQYVTETTSEVPESSRVVLGLQMGVLEPEFHDMFAERIAQVPIIGYSARFHEAVSCRVWVKEALYLLDDEGFLKLSMGVEDVEREATILAIINKSRGARTVALSGGGNLG